MCNNCLTAEPKHRNKNTPFGFIRFQLDPEVLTAPPCGQKVKKKKSEDMSIKLYLCLYLAWGWHIRTLSKAGEERRAAR